VKSTQLSVPGAVLVQEREIGIIELAEELIARTVVGCPSRSSDHFLTAL
jgi:hypothetical protein